MAGRGTLAPWAPPQALVVSGPYRYSRNPMYVAVLLVLSGWTTLFQSWVLAAYAVVIGTAFHLRILFGEEPWLARSARRAVGALSGAGSALVRDRTPQRLR